MTRMPRSYEQEIDVLEFQARRLPRSLFRWWTLMQIKTLRREVAHLRDNQIELLIQEENEKRLGSRPDKRGRR